MRQLTDPGAGLTVTRSFEPFGGVLSDQGDGASAYGFAGEWADATGLVHLRARYYFPVDSRFIQKDPAWQNLYPYIYASNNPITLVDPSGFCWEWSERYGFLNIRSIPPQNGPCPGSILEQESGDFNGPLVANLLVTDPDPELQLLRLIQTSLAIINKENQLFCTPEDYQAPMYTAGDVNPLWKVLLYATDVEINLYKEIRLFGGSIPGILPLQPSGGVSYVLRRRYQGLGGSYVVSYDTKAKIGVSGGVPFGRLGIQLGSSLQGGKITGAEVYGQAGPFGLVLGRSGNEAKTAVYFSGGAQGMEVGILQTPYEQRWILTTSETVAEAGGYNEFSLAYLGRGYRFAGVMAESQDREWLLNRFNLRYLIQLEEFP